MAYKDDQEQKDTKPHGDRDYTSEERQEIIKQQAAQTHQQGVQQEGGTGRKGLFSRMRDAITGGVSNAGKNAKKGYSNWKAEAKDNNSGGGILTSGLKGVLTSLASPKKLAVLASALGVGSFSMFGLFSTYKNDGVAKNDNPLSCETGYVEFQPKLTAKANIKQDTVNTMYDVFCRDLGYSEDFLIGMLSCMTAECNLNYSNIERDWNSEGPTEADKQANKARRYEFFYNIAGGGDDEVLDTNPTTEQVLNAYYNYSDLIGPTWVDLPDKNVDIYTCDNGRFGVGIGLIGWTGNNGVDFLTGVDRIYQDYDWYDLPYQCAYILASFKQDDTDSMMQNGKWRAEMQTAMKDMFEPTGGTDPATGQKLYRYKGDLAARSSTNVDADALPEDILGMCAGAKWYFERYVNGGASDTCGYNHIIDRWNNIPEVKNMVAEAKVNGQYSQDITSMADLLYINKVNEKTYNAQNAQICQNGTVVDDVNIALAAVSISWLEKADYKDDEAAYGEYRRSPMAPLLINDWDFVNTRDNGEPGGTKESHKTGEKYPEGTSLDGLDKYSAEACGYNHDLIACTEFYYYAHLVAFPKETDTGYFSSCDRGTGTAVRISGADDRFPAGAPYHQLSYALGSNVENPYGAPPENRNDQHNGQNQKLWKPTGFMRGSDWYSFEGRNGITPGNIMISWNQAHANGFGDNTWDVADDADEANLRFVLTNTMTSGHIMTFSGGGAVRTYWGMKYLIDQYDGYNDTSSLVRGDLTVQAPKIMQDAANFKAMYAKDAFDQNITFYMSQYQHAEDGERPIKDGGSATTSFVTHRFDTQYNQKTGLPEFRSWEQIFMRLTHNADDNNAAHQAYSTNNDGYLDGKDDHITQYGTVASSSTKANMYFTQDWDHAGGSGDVYGDPSGDAKWYDNGVDKWTNAFLNGGKNGYWRYELATDAEYRTNQLERFSMAAFMCSYASEDDASIYQNEENADAGDNASGHILGNVYRRMSRIGEDSDMSGRYYYYNTVLSNDMFQDLVQLYNMEAPDHSTIQNGKNFGPYYDVSDVMLGAQSETYYGRIGDRRYGLTAYDISNILAGYARPDAYSNNGIDETPGWGTDEGQIFDFGVAMNDEGSFSNRMYKYMSTPLYDIKKEIQGYGMGSATGNEGNHNRNEKTDVYYSIIEEMGVKKAVAQELYGINPFLMIKQYEGNVGTRGDCRDPAEIAMDKWLSFIDRHYYPDDNGNVNMYAYAVLAMNPSAGFETNNGIPYSTAMNNEAILETVNADNKKMSSCIGKLRYTDYIYCEGSTDDMYKRLYENDDRDGNGQRDDYNRREYILIPYYHTHVQNCGHDHRLPNVGYLVDCDWTPDPNSPKIFSEDSHKIDTIYYLNENCKDSITTVSFDSRTDLRGKYSIDQLAVLSACKNGGQILYFIDGPSGPTKVDYTATPPGIHVKCGGYTFSNPADAAGPATCDFPGCGNSVDPGGSCPHSCEECLSKSFVHDHDECDGGDICHDQYGCSALEYYYHTGTKVYMALTVVDDPKEEFDINDYVVNGKIVCDKANLLQLIGYDDDGYVKTDYTEPLETLCSPSNVGASGLACPPPGKVYCHMASLNPGYRKKFVGYFTIEGNVITREFDECGEAVEQARVCTKEDLILIESIRNRVGTGKTGCAEMGQRIFQDNNPFTGFPTVMYDNQPRDNGTTQSGYGEIMVTGASHDLSPASASMTASLIGNAGWLCGEYGDPNTTGGSGPDTALGNRALGFGNSLMRYLLGDEHVYHVRFGSQDKELITGESNPSTGYDFQYFKEFVDIDVDAVYRDYETGLLTLREYNEKADVYKDPDTGEYGPEAEELRNIPLPIYDKPASNTPGSLNKPFDSSGKTVIEELIERYNDPNGDGNDDDKVHGWDNGPNGDYGLWITHASRGDRGMKTEYIVMKDWFGDPYDNDYTSVNMQYMAFEPVMQKDVTDVDGDGDTEEPYIYQNAPGDAVILDAVYGQGSNSHWRNLIDIYTASLQSSQ